MSETKLVNTKEAAKAVGLSEFELRNGWKSGKYPALPIGGTDAGRGVRLRWNLELLHKTIVEEMTNATSTT